MVLGVPFFIVAIHDTDGTVRIRVNNGTLESGTATTANANCTDPMFFGSQFGTVRWLDGFLDAWGLWERVLTTDEQTALYNGGSGLEHPF